MRTIFTLFMLDLLSIKRWFHSQSMSKLIVLVGFTVVFSVIAWVIYAYTKIFFTNLKEFAQFGEFTIEYLFHASLVMVGWFTIWSAIAASMTSILTSTRDRDFLLTQPISSQMIMLWLSSKIFFINLLLFLILFMPVLLAYRSVSQPLSLSLFIGMSTLIIATVVLFAHSVGTFIGIKTAVFLQGKRWIAFVGGFMLFFLSAYMLLGIIFPRKLVTLYNAAPEEFAAIYESLPLSSPALPTKWLVDALHNGGGIYLGIAIGISLITALLVFFLLRKDIVLITQRIRENVLHNRVSTSLRVRKSSKLFTQSRSGIFIKDWLSLVRTPSEVGYATLLLLLLIFFFLLFSQTLRLQSDTILSATTVLFMYIWFMFFTTAYILRIVFPLMAREGHTRWYLLTLPISYRDIVKQKIATSFSLIIPHFLVVIVLWLVLPMPWVLKGVTIILSIISVISLVAVAIIYGFRNPQFAYSLEPEKTSTSTRGVAALLVSALVTGIGAYLLYLMWTNAISLMGMSIIFCLVVLGLGLIYLRFNQQLSSDEKEIRNFS